MSLNDPLANALSKIDNYEKGVKQKCLLKPVSKVIKRILQILKDNGYVGDFKEIYDSKGNSVKVNLMGTINRCGVIKPNHAVGKDDYEKFEKRYLPSKNVGLIIVSTSEGIMTNTEAKEKALGGKLLAYCY